MDQSHSSGTLDASEIVQPRRSMESGIKSGEQWQQGKVFKEGVV